MPSVIAALASTFFGMSYTLPKPWCFLSVVISAGLVGLLRSL